ncbi:MAG: hypothetical protein NXI32_05025 [bacterium]|nr:hypothetical protein [bacterium]
MTKERFVAPASAFKITKAKDIQPPEEKKPDEAPEGEAETQEPKQKEEPKNPLLPDTDLLF